MGHQRNHGDCSKHTKLSLTIYKILEYGDCFCCCRCLFCLLVFSVFFFVFFVFFVFLSFCLFVFFVFLSFLSFLSFCLFCLFVFFVFLSFLPFSLFSLFCPFVFFVTTIIIMGSISTTTPIFFSNPTIFQFYHTFHHKPLPLLPPPYHDVLCT